MEFDVNDQDGDPAEREAELQRLRREDPVHWDARNGFWLLTKHADVREASKQPELFSSQAKGPWPRRTATRRSSPIPTPSASTAPRTST